MRLLQYEHQENILGCCVGDFKLEMGHFIFKFSVQTLASSKNNLIFLFLEFVLMMRSWIHILKPQKQLMVIYQYIVDCQAEGNHSDSSRHALHVTPVHEMTIIAQELIKRFNFVNIG